MAGGTSTAGVPTRTDGSWRAIAVQPGTMNAARTIGQAPNGLSVTRRQAPRRALPSAPGAHTHTNTHAHTTISTSHRAQAGHGLHPPPPPPGQGFCEGRGVQPPPQRPTSSGAELLNGEGGKEPPPPPPPPELANPQANESPKESAGRVTWRAGAELAGVGTKWAPICHGWAGLQLLGVGGSVGSGWTAPPPPPKRADLTGPQNPTETDSWAPEVTRTQNFAKDENGIVGISALRGFRIVTIC